jgi:nitrate/TMAO reductase-like tetraheme cytochrome c subunit
MKGLFNWLRRFFFPPVGSPRWRRVLPYAILGVLTIIVLAGANYGWEYTNSPAFCGTACHTMPPEYTAYQISPHARVACVDCHLGRDTFTLTFGRKAGDLRHVIFYLGKNYEVPIYATSMRPASASCEKCHWPEKFSNDKVRSIQRFSTDDKNSATQIALVMHTGGGSSRVGLGRGIHWHIESAGGSKVEFYSTDPLKQTIPYVRVTDATGKVTEYFDTEAQLPRDQIQAAIQKGELKQMDCIDCHNRVTHNFRTPASAIDQAMGFKQIDPAIPAIKSKGLDIFGGKYKSIDEALAAFDSLNNFYQTKYPDYASKNANTINAAITQFKTLYQESVFPGMEVNWDTHPDNLGHREFPGCFRCHDGKHVADSGTTVRLECNVCHSLPQVALPGQPAPNVVIGVPPEPASHKDTNWMFKHRTTMDQTCAGCHDIKNAGQATNDSFCSNAACHGVDWKFAALNAPGLRAKMAATQPQPTPQATPAGGATPSASGPVSYAAGIGQLFAAKCSACHGDTVIMGLKLTDYASAMKGSQNGPVIVPGKSADSLLVKKQSAGGHPGQFTPDELAQVKTWIDGGALETGQGQPAAGATPTTLAPAAATPTAQATAPAGGGAPPFIPHDLAGRDNCLTCHTPEGGVKPAPKDHAGRANETCQACHKPKS